MSLGDDATSLFNGVTGVVRLGDGSIIVGDRGSDELRRYSETGEYLGSGGGSGGGPGEFISRTSPGLGAIGRSIGDSVRAHHVWGNNVYVFDPELRYVRSISLAGESGSQAAIASVSGWLDDGSIVSYASDFGGSGLGTTTAGDGFQLVRSTIRVGLRSADGEPIRDLAVVPGAERLFRSETVNGRSTFTSVNVPFPKREEIGVGSSAIAVGSTHLFDFRIFDTGGSLRTIVRSREQPRRATPSDISAWRATRRPADGSPVPGTVRDEASRIETTIPAFNHLFVDQQDRIWVELNEWPVAPEADARWRVYDPLGTVLAEVEIPRRFRPYDIGPDYLLGVWRDEWDVEHVQLYRLETD